MSRATASLDAVQVVSFDLDDTLWDCAPAITNAENALFEWHRNNTPRITDEHNPYSLQQMRNGFRARYPELAGCVTAIRKQGLKDLLVEFDYPESMADEAFALFYRVRSEVDLYPQVKQLLDMLSKRYKLVAITNGNADMHQIGIAGYFDAVFAANLELKAKPDADMFDRCCNHFGVSSAQVLHIGDNPVTDVLGAHRVGMQTLWYNPAALEWEHSDAEPHFEVHSIAQMFTLFG